MADAQISIVAKAIDQASGTLNRVEKSVRSIEKSVGLAGRGFGKFNAVLQGLGVGVGIGSFYAIERAIGRLLGIIPDLLDKGHQWAATVDDFSDATGVGAEKASELLSIQKALGGSTDALTRSVVIASSSVRDHADRWEKAGVKVKDAKGNFLDMGTVLDNLRRKLSQTGASAQTTAFLRDVLGRGATDLIDLLTLSSEKYDEMAAAARRAGTVITSAQAAQAEALERTKGALDMAITGIGAQLGGAINPLLTQFIQGIANVITANLSNIVRFLGQVAAGVTGLVGGLFGIRLSMDALTGSTAGSIPTFNEWYLQQTLGQNTVKKAASGTDAFTAAINRQIAAVDREMQALDRSDRKQQSRREWQQTLADVRSARKELSDIKGQSIFAAGMSEAEAELARQAQARSVMDGEKKVQDALKKRADLARKQDQDSERQALQDRRQHLQDQLAQHQLALGRIATANTTFAHKSMAEWRKEYGQFVAAQKANATQLATVFTPALTSALDDALKFGQGIAESIKAAIFGDPVTKTLFGGHGKSGLTVEVGRTGGLITWLQNVGTWLGNLVTTISGFSTWLQNTLHLDLLQLALALFGLKLAMSIGSPLLALLSKLAPGGVPLPPAVTPPGGAPGGGVVTPAIGAGIVLYGDDAVDLWHRFLQDPRLQPNGTPSGSGSFQPGAPTGPLNSLLRRYLGDGSPLDQGQQDQQSTLAWIQANTQVLPDGTLETTLPDGTKIKTNVTDWNGGQLPTNIQNWLSTQAVTNPNLGKVNTWNAGKLSVQDSFFTGAGGNYLQNISSNTNSISAYLKWGGHSAATYLASINAVLQKKNPIIPAGSSAGAAGSASNPLHMKVTLTIPQARQMLRGEAVTSSLRPMTGT